MAAKSYTEGNDVEEIIRYRMRYSGLWWGLTDLKTKISTKVLIIVYLITIITQLVEVFLTRSDGKKILRSISILTFCIIGVFKLYSLTIRRDSWIYLIRECTLLEMDELNYKEPIKCYSEDEYSVKSFKDHIQIYTDQFRSTAKLIFRLYHFTLLVFISLPILEAGLAFYQGIEMGELPHILPSWGPLDGTLWGYSITLVIECTGCLTCVIAHSSFDISVVGLMIFIQGQFSLLHDFSEFIGGKGDNYNISKDRDYLAHFRIAKCHHIQVTLLKAFNELGELIQTIIGTYFVLATLTLCSIAVQFTWEEQTLTQLLSLLQYLGGTVTQLYLFCYFGDGVLTKSPIGLGEGPFCSAYWSLSPKVRREIAILCVGMSRRSQLRAGIFYSIDLPSFIMVIRTAYSYYAVVRGTAE